MMLLLRKNSYVCVGRSIRMVGKGNGGSKWRISAPNGIALKLNVLTIPDPVGTMMPTLNDVFESDKPCSCLRRSTETFRRRNSGSKCHTLAVPWDYSSLGMLSCIVAIF